MIDVDGVGNVSPATEGKNHRNQPTNSLRTLNITIVENY